ncbi:hypothetical protein ACIPJS_02645 [Streptomyces sp. NPDC086783]|uniref:hypothetical protein n=1 Tax=Streptomyces sp. NPDC086783 TaxID=3365758 RepID=UPI0037F9CCA4
MTAIQRRLALHDVRDEGAGSTPQELQRYGLIEVCEEVKEEARGQSKTVPAKLTRAGRAAAPPGPRLCEACRFSGESSTGRRCVVVSLLA